MEADARHYDTESRLVQALREAIPEEFSGLYSPEEMPVDDSQLDEEPITVDYEEIEGDEKSLKSRPKHYLNLAIKILLSSVSKH